MGAITRLGELQERKLSKYLPALLAVLSYPTAFVLSSVQFDLKTSLLAASIGLGVVGVSAGVGGAAGTIEASRQLRNANHSPDEIDRIYEELSVIRGQFEGAVSRLRTSLGGDGLQTTAEIAAYELVCTCSEIWVVSRDLALDLSPEEYIDDATRRSLLGGAPADPSESDDLTFDEIISGNLRRGVSYVYLLPDTEKMRREARRLRDGTFKAGQLGRLEFVFLTPKEIRTLPYTEGNFAVFVPLATTTGEPVRIQAEFPSADKAFWITVTGDPAMLWVDRVRPILEVARNRKRPGES